ncbi:Uu.00g052280.m01.CDS01 [Anthostomella pinea]|uniref:Uu.00g052280.m01.CDS01 n=1 Tax=Anthostomella pinea TaxID=933095 RepID=A0AAI8YPD8_9PEZI|nr:Uu.00g052280.m01.CDS01 [Anthostomella pinea]
MSHSSANQCCAGIANVLGNKVYFPGESGYNTTETSYWSLQEASVAPACVVQPETTVEVVSFISIVTKTTNCSFAIKTQGHAPAAGAANIADGVTLDISWLNGRDLNDDHSVASVGPGSAWLDVYTALQPFNRTVAGGRNGAVGVGGLTLGGGISYFSPQVGWTCDTVVNFEIVLSSAEIVNANATSNPDLFRALKGGGNNFGVVTRIDFATIDTVPLRAGHLIQSSEYIKPVLTAFANIASAEDYDVHASITTSFTFNVTTSGWTIASIPVYTLPETDPAVYQELFSIPNITAQSTVLAENISTLAAEGPYPQSYQRFLTSTYAASAVLLIEIFGVANQTLRSARSPSDISYSLTFEPLPAVLTQHGAGKNVLGTSEADGNGVVLLISTSWSNSNSSSFAQSMSRKLLQAMDDTAAAPGGLHQFKYMNYADPSQDPLESYGSKNLAFLRAVSARYDPSGIFQKKVPGGFKLG